MARAQMPDGNLRTSAPMVRGTVYDSLAREPLAGAMVQLVRAESVGTVRSVTTDSSGQYAFAGVTTGRYRIGFLHPRLDALGLVPPVREVTVRASEVVHADLWIPPASRIQSALCRGASDAAAVTVGRVRDARDGMPVGGAAVTGSWLEFSIRADGIRQDVPTIRATSSDDGWFALCGVPRGGTMVLAARHGTDTTDVEVQVPATGLVHHDLYLGAAWLAAGSDTPDTSDAGRAERRVRYAGPGRIHGTVRSAAGDRPIAGARVRLVGGPEATADEQGAWALSDAPAGSRMLEVRALGFHPQYQAVNVIPGAPPVRTALATLKSVLDTVRVVTSRNRLHGTGFDERSRQGMGRFLDAAALGRRHAIFTSDYLRMVPGVQVERTSLGDTYFTMRGAFGRCSPHIYIDGMHMRGLTGDDVNAFANPEDIAGIEIYTGAMVPPQFQQGMSGCGSIVIWTKPPMALATKWTWRRVARALGLVVLGVGLGSLIT